MHNYNIIISPCSFLQLGGGAQPHTTAEQISGPSGVKLGHRSTKSLFSWADRSAMWPFMKSIFEGILE